MRERLRDWPQKVYKYYCIPVDIPESLRQESLLAKETWNKLQELGVIARQKYYGLIGDNKELYAENKKKNKEEIRVLFSEFRSKCREIAKLSGLYWCNHEKLLMEYETAFQKCFRSGTEVKPWARERLSFSHRFTGGGLPSNKIFSGNSKRLSLDINYTKGKKTSGLLQVAVPKDIAVFNILLHRPLPEGFIKRFEIREEEFKNKLRWYACITVESPQSYRAHSDDRKECAIDVGYRKTESGIRLGLVLDDDGVDEITLSNKYLERIERLRFLISERTLLKNEGLIKEREYRLADRELKGLRKRILLSRKEFYYLISHELCRKYKRIVIEEFDLSKVASKKKATEAGIWSAARGQRFIVSLSEFRGCLSQVANCYETIIDLRKAAYTTLACSNCGNLMNPIKPQLLVWECEHCGTKIDQDENAARNLLYGFKNEKNIKSLVAHGNNT